MSSSSAPTQQTAQISGRRTLRRHCNPGHHWRLVSITKHCSACAEWQLAAGDADLQCQCDHQKSVSRESHGRPFPEVESEGHDFARIEPQHYCVVSRRHGGRPVLVRQPEEPLRIAHEPLIDYAERSDGV